MRFLMCKNTPVLDIETLEAFSSELLPGLLKNELTQSTLDDFMGFAPLFDFNHAKDFEWVPDPTTNRLLSVVTDENRQYAISLTEQLRQGTTDNVYIQRATNILDRLH